MVEDIRTCTPEDRLTAHANGGDQVYNLIANLKILPIKVHIKKSSMATILSFKTVSEIPGAMMHLETATSTDGTLISKDDRVIVFKKFKNGIYFYDANVDLCKT